MTEEQQIAEKMAEIHAYIDNAPVALNGAINNNDLFFIILAHVRDENAGNAAIEEQNAKATT